MKTALVTGGSRGIGRAIVELLTLRGWQVAFLYNKNTDAADEVCKKTGAVSYQADVADRAAIDNAVSDFLARFGHIDLLVNNAACAEQCLFTDITLAKWQRMIDVNLTGAFNCTQNVLPSMVSRKTGAIVFISSMWGVEGGSCEVHYSATKAALIGMTKSLAKEVGPSGIRVNCVAPGVIDTDMNAQLSEADMEELKQSTALCRIGTPADVAGVVAFLADDDAGFITGQVIGVDGGIVV